ncbi:MAG: redoxin domain-containing protein [Candidatus Hydrogenedentes bacterium]|nr:redoxin domain-containing protein [Candidatus Hydrogenedentota bacterium]
MADEGYSAGPPPLNPSGNMGFAITSLVLGILAICLSVLAVGALLGMLGVVFGAVHLAKGRPAARAMAGWGLGLSALGTVAGLSFIGLYTYAFFQILPMFDLDGYEEDFSRWEGVRAPDFTVTDLDGAEVTLSALRGKRVIVDIWATWCPPCVQEIPHFIQLASELTDDLVIVGISDEDEETLRAFAETKGINYVLASSDDLPSPYGDVVSIPTTFFIDRNGVIQQVLTGYHDLEDLREAATAPDFDGEALDAPPVAPDDLVAAERPLEPRQDWAREVADATAMCVGDWNGDGAPEILVADYTPAVHIFDLDGQALGTVPLPETVSVLSMGRHSSGPRLLGHEDWGDAVYVVDGSGETMWTYESWIGINGAHWGDVDGDSDDEMIVGMNGGGGLHLVSADGERRWKKSLGNVWNQSYVRSPDGAVRILATEAGGSVRVFDGEGKQLDSLQPEGEYCSEVLGGLGPGGAIQFMTSGSGRAMLCDVDGTVLWGTPVPDDHGAWRSVTFAHGDIDGDGVGEWAFVGLDDELVVATVAGERLATLPGQEDLMSFAIAAGRLITLSGEILAAYSFEPGAVLEVSPDGALTGEGEEAEMAAPDAPEEVPAEAGAPQAETPDN